MSDPTPGPGADPTHDAATGPVESGRDDARGAGGASPTRGEPFECPYCDRRFVREDWLALHEGLDHELALTPAERAAYDAAREAEEEALRLFRYKALGALVLLYFGFVLLYAVSL